MSNNHLPFTLIDLTHTLSSKIPSWDGKCGFNHDIKRDYDTTTPSTKFRTHTLQMEAGIGTHMDAPIHCIPGGLTISDLSLNRLAAPCVIIDVSLKAHERYKITVHDVRDFEETYGQIPEHAFVIFQTGWERFWHTPDQYRNNYIFPSICKEAALLLLDRRIAGIGIDTLSPDLPEDGFPIHQLILDSGKYIVENITNIKHMPKTGAFSLTLPIKILGGTEAPVRLVGLILN